MKHYPAKLLLCLGTSLLVTGCLHYKEESGRKTDYNGTTGRFETSDYASAGLTTAKPEPRAVSQDELKKASVK